MQNRFSRRYFFYGTLLAGAVPAGGFGSTPSLTALGYKSFNQKLNIAGVGVGTRGPAILQGAAPTENIVALCDVDEVRSAPAFRTYAKAAKYKDYRKMFEKEGKNIDAVMIATPDHLHTPIALLAMQHGQARVLREAADPHRVGSAPAGRRGGEVQGGHADGQPGLQSRGHEDGVRNSLVGRYRRGAGSARLDRRRSTAGSRIFPPPARKPRRRRARWIGTCGWGRRRRARSIR